MLTNDERVLIDDIRKCITETMENAKHPIVQGQVPNFEEYKYNLGGLHAAQYILGYLDGIEKKAELKFLKGEEE